MNPLKNALASIREINRKYAKPEIEMTRFVKICLLALRVYLVGMVGLMVYGLVVAANAGTNPADKTTTPGPSTQPAAQKSAVPISAPVTLARFTGPRS